MRRKRWVLRTVLWLAVLLAVAAAAYGSYVALSYQRIEGEGPLMVQNDQAATLPAGKSLSVITLDAGFGAFSRDFTYFMDGGWRAKAKSPDSVRTNLRALLSEVRLQDPSLLLVQQIDEDADRSRHVNEREMIVETLADFGSVYAETMDSSYLLYPLGDPIGRVRSGMLTLSRYRVEGAMRVPLPVSEGQEKFFDMDRCLLSARLPVDNGRYLTLVNAQLSPWLEDEEVRSAQTRSLIQLLRAARAVGDYVVCGGGFARDLLGGESSQLFAREWRDEKWCQPFEEEALGADFMIAAPVNAPTVRDSENVYHEGESYVAVTDGFIVSTDVTIVDVKTDNTGFAYSNHNPVALRFQLN